MGRNKIIACILLLVMMVLLSSCAKSQDYQQSLSTKEFLFKSGYSLMIDGNEVTKYDKDTLSIFTGDVVMELIAENGTKVTEIFLLKEDKEWTTFPGTAISAKVFKSG